MERVRGFNPETQKIKEIWLPRKTIEEGPVVCQRMKEDGGKRWFVRIGDEEIQLTNYSKSKLLGIYNPNRRTKKKASGEETAASFPHSF